MFAWSQLDFSAIPVSISAVSSTGRLTWQNVTVREDCKELQMYRREKTSEKETSSSFVFFPFVFGEKFPTAEF
jgi:hypothetical protein